MRHVQEFPITGGEKPAVGEKFLADLFQPLDMVDVIGDSKGKGFHVFVFLSDWVAAVHMRRILHYALQIAGLPETTEIFPKQDQLTVDTPWGNYLNLWMSERL